jgi:hypothetical protein
VTPSECDWAIIVADIKKIAEQRDTRRVNRGDAYTPPRLKEFGPVGALTQAGTGLKTEQTSGQGPTTKKL